MAKRASQAGDTRTTDRTGAPCLGTEVNTRGKRRRWTAERKHQIVVEGMEPGVSAAMVACKHGISRGQFYAWRQHLLLRGALGSGADTMPSLAGVDVTTAALHLEPAIPAPPEAGTPATAAALVLPVQPDNRVGVTVPDGVAGRLDEDCGVEHARTTDRTSVLNSPLAARADCGQADRSGDTASPGALAYALRRVCQGDIDCIGRSPVPGEQLLKLVALGAAGDQTLEHVGQIGERIDAVQLCCVNQGQCNSPMICGAVRAGEQSVLPSHCDPLHAALDDIYVGSTEHINGGDRWIMCLHGVEPNILRTMPKVREAVENVRLYRLGLLPPRKDPDGANNKASALSLSLAKTPTAYHVTVLPNRPFMVIPEVSSERRSYLPIAWLEPPTIPSNKLLVALDVELHHFALITSRMHMAWTSYVGGRLKSDYQYSPGINYNRKRCDGSTLRNAMKIGPPVVLEEGRQSDGRGVGI